MIKIRPLYDRIVVKRIEDSETVRGGIIIPDSAKEKPQEGEVMAIGHGKRLENGTMVPLSYKMQNGDTVEVITQKNHVPSKDFIASDTSNLQAGQKVEHQKFGFGEVMKMEGSAHNPIATVKFDLNGEKKIMLNYAKLRIME